MRLWLLPALAVKVKSEPSKKVKEIIKVLIVSLMEGANKPVRSKSFGLIARNPFRKKKPAQNL